MVEQIYTDFLTALREDDGEQAIALADEYLEVLSAQTGVDIAREVAARRYLTQGITQDDRETTARTVIEAGEQTRQLRAQSGALVHALASGQLDFERGANITEELIDVQETLDSAYEELRADDALEQVGPILVADSDSSLEVQKAVDETTRGRGPNSGNGNPNRGGGNGGGPPTGTVVETSATVVVRNAGGEAATDLDVDVDETPLSGVDVRPATVSEIGPDEQAELTVEVSRSNPAGRYTLTIQIGSGADGVSESIQVIVADKQRYVEDAITSLEDLRDVFEGIGQETDRSMRSFLRITNRSRRDLETVRDDLDDGSMDAKGANQELFSTKQGLSGLPSKIETLAMLSGAERASLTSEVDAIVDSIERAMGAGIEH
ncbi:hypothetical protein [Natrarchaeobius oligotrophus]|uniref:Uncharacterized protein n=1 Tax=Natrarchaeobius chitinivorans TaxID=1679083 RepID=A0A3N6MVC7_NATCH|nr:hypothetical protein [Natrarchaeobius chitinivorans]RQH01911.1 hypothetical protein EA472_06290 [Natrarchaeobius chitinivorans]